MIMSPEGRLWEALIYRYLVSSREVRTSKWT